ncbi:MAG: heparinase II/III family protein [Bacteroidales bacterium]|nr:heparinase II/III-family protein [Bacteroidales bacterium]
MKKIFYILILLIYSNLTVCCETYDLGPKYEKGSQKIVDDSQEIVLVVAKAKDTIKLFDKPLMDHPRLLFTKESEIALKNAVNSNPLLNNLLSLLKTKANTLLNTPMYAYPTGASDILVVSREHLYRMITLALAYRMFNDSRYAAKAEENLINVCNYPDWDPDHYLDVSEMTEAVAIGYDWLYDVLSDNTKALIRNSLKEKALLLAVNEYNTGGLVWAKRESNWNVVCNTSMILGALAIAENEPVMAENIITEGVKCVPICLQYFDPDGVCYEGPGYWYYTNVNLAMLMNCLNDNLGNDLGLSALPGISKTAAYYEASVSPSGRIFDFADTGSGVPNNGPAYFYFSKKFNLPRVAEFYRSLIQGVINSPSKFPKWHFFLNIPWYDASVPSTSSDIPRLQIFDSSVNPIMVFNGNRSSTNSIYLIAKGGAGDVAHQHLDIGSFVLETNGVRWMDDLGCVAADYSLAGFWDYTAITGQRWKYFRYNNFCHNTVSIDNTLQYSTGRGKILRYDKDSEKPFSIIDMTTVYKNLATKAYRGFMLLSDNLALIQDEISLAPGAKQIEWTSVTSASVTINGNTATLQKNGKSFYIKIISPANATFTKTTAKTNSSQEAAINGFYLLKTKVSPADGTNQIIQIVMSSDQNAINDTNLTGSLQPFSNWK